MVTIYLGDLSHTWGKKGIWTMPLNIGYISSYLKKQYSNINIKLFKDPENLIRQIKHSPPDIIGLSHYVWNENLNSLIYKICKEVKHDMLTVGGGPRFTDLNANISEGRVFFESTPNCDAFILNQGELGFYFLVKDYLKYRNIGLLLSQPIDGCLSIALNKKIVFKGKEIPNIKDLNEIPSPYLTGEMDEFFSEAYIPIIETNRSCPYRCTFCAWGVGSNKLTRFDTKRVLNEVEYISKKTKLVSNLYIADANFGILERDIYIARKMKKCNQKYGYPGHVVPLWNKIRSDRVERVFREFEGIAEIGASMQTMDKDVLIEIKRKNLSLESIKRINDNLNTNFYSELIFGLPNETYESHINANRKLVNLGFETFNYVLDLLPGTEMNLLSNRERFIKKTGFRLVENAYGIYEGIKIFEELEIVLETKTISQLEMRKGRLFHTLLQLLWGRKWYFHFFKFLKESNINTVSFIEFLCNRENYEGTYIEEVMLKFYEDLTNDTFKYKEQLFDYWALEENFKHLKSGDFGDLKEVYTYEFLSRKEDLKNYLKNCLKFYIEKEEIIINDDLFFERVNDVLQFCEARHIIIDNKFNIIERAQYFFNHDFKSWENNGYSNLKDLQCSSKLKIEFYLKDKQLKNLQKQLKQFQSSNLKETLRNMTLDTRSEQFFYQYK